jgi:prepilin-type N-terminal cleavage/methylation domain-containing protein
VRRAFTLIELLLVIIIIAILASIIFPIIAAAKDSGYRASAVAQSSELAKAIVMYVEQSDGDYCPSTNYGAATTDPNRMWQNSLMPFVKSQKMFVAPGTKGAFALSWDDRGMLSWGLNSATALDETNGCADDQENTNGCLAFKDVASFDKSDQPASVAILAVTPPGPTDQRYRGYEFSPYNGITDTSDEALSPPLTSDRDLVAELKSVPADLLKPVYCRYNSDQHDHGTTPVIFADGHAKEYNVKQILSTGAGIVWRFR